MPNNEEPVPARLVFEPERNTHEVISILLVKGVDKLVSLVRVVHIRPERGSKLVKSVIAPLLKRVV